MVFSSPEKVDEAARLIEGGGYLPLLKIKPPRDRKGYWDYKVSFLGPNGTVMEIILVDDYLAKVKAGIGHRLYDYTRQISDVLKANEAGKIEISIERKKLLVDFLIGLKQISDEVYSNPQFDLESMSKALSAEITLASSGMLQLKGLSTSFDEVLSKDNMTTWPELLEKAHSLQTSSSSQNDMKQSYPSKSLRENAMDASNDNVPSGSYWEQVYDEVAGSNGALFQRIDKQRDSEYLQAIAKGDMKKAQAMVEEEARRKGYVSDESYRDSHGAPKATVPAEDFTNLDRLREGMKESASVSLYGMANGISLVPDDYFGPDGTSLYDIGGEEGGLESYSGISSAMEKVRRWQQEGKDVSKLRVVVYRAVPKGVKDGRLRSGGQWVSPSRSYVEQHGRSRFGAGNYRVFYEHVPVTDLWWNGDSINEWGYDDGKQYAYRNTKNNVKSLDAVTYDGEGNIVPLSKRFDSRNSDVLFELTEDQKKEFTSKWRIDVEWAVRNDVIVPTRVLEQFKGEDWADEGL